MRDTITVDNQRPHSSFGFQTVIPARTSTYLQLIPQPVNLDTHSNNFISTIIIRIDSAGFYNIPTDETFQLNGAPATILRGNYTNAELQTIANVTFTASGANSQKYTNTQSLQFIQNSNLAYVLGYQDLGTAVIPPNTIAPGTQNLTGDLDFLLIQSDLVSTGSAFNSNFVTAVPITISAVGPAVGSIQNLSLPLRSHNFSSILWSFFTAFGKPYVIDTPIVLFTQISSQKKSN
jgi:hypothetical protein